MDRLEVPAFHLIVTSMEESVSPTNRFREVQAVLDLPPHPTLPLPANEAATVCLSFSLRDPYARRLLRIGDEYEVTLRRLPPAECYYGGENLAGKE